MQYAMLSLDVLQDDIWRITLDSLAYLVVGFPNATNLLRLDGTVRSARAFHHTCCSLLNTSPKSLSVARVSSLAACMVKLTSFLESLDYLSTSSPE